MTLTIGQVKPFNQWFSVGVDSQGDACIYVQTLDDEGEPIRFLDEKEIQELVDRLNWKWEDWNAV